MPLFSGLSVGEWSVLFVMLFRNLLVAWYLKKTVMCFRLLDVGSKNKDRGFAMGRQAFLPSGEQPDVFNYTRSLTIPQKSKLRIYGFTQICNCVGARCDDCFKKLNQTIR